MGVVFGFFFMVLEMFFFILFDIDVFFWFVWLILVRIKVCMEKFVVLLFLSVIWFKLFIKFNEFLFIILKKVNI